MNPPFAKSATRLALLLIAAAASFGCNPKSEGPPRVVAIGGSLGPLASPTGKADPANAALLQNIARGLVALDASGNIVGGLAERWNVSNDGMSYIFRLAPTQWQGGGKVTARQVARLLTRQVHGPSHSALADALGAIDEIVAMTDRVIEIRLIAPRPNLLQLLAQPEMGIVRDGHGTGLFAIAEPEKANELWLRRDVPSDDDDGAVTSEQVVLSVAPTEEAVKRFVTGSADLVVGGTFADLPMTQRVKLPRGALLFDPVAGLFGLVPASVDGPISDPEVRQLLSEAIDREAIVAALAVPGLAPRATLLEPGLDGITEPAAPSWLSAPIGDRRAALRDRADRLLAKKNLDVKDWPVIKVALPEGLGADLLFEELALDWGMLGMKVERVKIGDRNADFVLIDEVAPSSSPAWFVRRFRCGTVRVCDLQTDKLADAARSAVVPAQRYALIGQAATKIDQSTAFIPIAAPIRWSLVGKRITGFTVNRYALHTFAGLERPRSSN